MQYHIYREFLLTLVSTVGLSSAVILVVVSGDDAAALQKTMVSVVMMEAAYHSKILVQQNIQPLSAFTSGQPCFELLFIDFDQAHRRGGPRVCHKFVEG
jgi:hypothetical protein